MDKGYLAKLINRLDPYRYSISHFIGELSLIGLSIWLGFWIQNQTVVLQKLQEDAKTNGTEISNYDILEFWTFKWTTLSCGLAVLATGYGYYGNIVAAREKTKEIIKLKKELEEREDLPSQLEEAQVAIDELKISHENSVYDAISDVLKHLSCDYLEFGDTERISLYLHDGERFILAGRFSKHPVYIKKSRPAFPDDQGCIGKTWNEGESFFELPDPEGSEQNEKDYLDELKTTYNINNGIAKELRMKSRVYCGKAIEEYSVRCGVIIFESTRTDIISERRVNDVMRNHESILVTSLHRSRQANPTINYQNGNS